MHSVQAIALTPWRKARFCFLLCSRYSKSRKDAPQREWDSMFRPSFRWECWREKLSAGEQTVKDSSQKKPRLLNYLSWYFKVSKFKQKLPRFSPPFFCLNLAVCEFVWMCFLPLSQLPTSQLELERWRHTAEFLYIWPSQIREYLLAHSHIPLL